MSEQLQSVLKVKPHLVRIVSVTKSYAKIFYHEVTYDVNFSCKNLHKFEHAATSRDVRNPADFISVSGDTTSCSYAQELIIFLKSYKV
jgi:hypothetical protein